MIKDIISPILRHMVDNPDELVVKQTETDDTIFVTVTPSPQDIGQLIGKQGRTAKALRTLCTIITAKNSKRFVFQILDASNGKKSKVN